MRYDAFYNGKFDVKENIRIPLCDRAVFFGDGIYDAAIGKRGKIYLLDEHIRRFISNAKAMRIPLNITEGKLRELLLEMAAMAPYEGFFIYFQLTRYSESRIHAYPDTEKSNLLITTSPLILKSPDKALRLVSYPDIRYLMCHIKTLNLLPAVLASKYAEELGADEAVLHRDDTVTECAHSNIFICKDGILYTHPQGKYILPGISRARLISLAGEQGFFVKETEFTVRDIYECDEIIITSSSKLALRAEKFNQSFYDLDKMGIGYRLCSLMREDFEANT